MIFPCIIPFLCFGMLTHAATVIYDFNVSWVTANPDGLHARPVMGINGQWPIPYITANVGDRVVVNVQNHLGNTTTSLHFHGLYQNGTTEMDGVVGATQCPIGIGESFTYNFTIDQPGTYWYHTHELAQYPDGMRGPLIITDPDSPYKGKYDEERVLTVSDWYHDLMPNLLKAFISVLNPTGAEPVPKSALFNDTQNLTTAVEPGKTYLFRIINIGAFAGQYVWFEGHTMQIVEVDGIYTKQAAADMIYVTAAQRYSVLITTKNDTSTNFAYCASMDKDLFDKVPASLNPNVTGWLVYDERAILPPPAPLASFDPFDDFTLVPEDGEPLLPNPDQTIPLTMRMDNLGDGANYAFFNDITYVRPKVPTLFTALTTGPTASNPSIYSPNTNAFVLAHNDIIDIVLNNADKGKHPFHLHGHTFQTIVRSPSNAGTYNTNTNTNTTSASTSSFPSTPMKRDTIMVHPNSNIVLRFRADNPGIWLFHCHIEWHVASGLVATMIEAPLALQKSLTLPQQHIDACTKQEIPVAGNAAGNTKDLFDMTGANVSPAPLPDGFTARGWVALVFSILSALMGIAVIAWYGAGEIGMKVGEKDMQEAIGAETKTAAEE